MVEQASALQGLGNLQEIISRDMANLCETSETLSTRFSTCYERLHEGVIQLEQMSALKLLLFAINRLVNGAWKNLSNIFLFSLQFFSDK